MYRWTKCSTFLVFNIIINLTGTLGQFQPDPSYTSGNVSNNKNLLSNFTI